MITTVVIPPSEPQEQNVLRVKRGIVLIVEDHADTRGFIHDILCAEGFVVVAVPHRDAAALVLKCLKIEIILMDYFMDGMSAFQFVTQAREQNPDVRIVLMTSPDYVETAAEMLGIDEVLPKPVTAEAIRRLLRVGKEVQQA